jgi:hypothetical protein
MVRLRDAVHAFFLKQLFRDLYLAGAAFALLFLCLAFHTGSICLATCGMLHIVLSVPISYGIYMQQLEFEVFPYINLIGIFVVAGIGVDDIYVFTDAWKQSFYLRARDNVVPSHSARKPQDVPGQMVLLLLSPSEEPETRGPHLRSGRCRSGI